MPTEVELLQAKVELVQQETAKLRLQMATVRDELPDYRKLADAVDRLTEAVNGLTSRIEPLEKHMDEEQRQKDRIQWAIAQGLMTEDGARVVPAGVAVAAGAAGAAQGVIEAGHRPRIWESEDGRSVITKSLIAAVLIALAIGGGMTFSDLGPYLPSFGGDAVEETTTPDTFGPPLPKYEGPQDDSPIEPRPNL